MVDRLRLLLDRPLDPSVARAIVVLSGAILLGLAALFLLGISQSGTAARTEEPTPAPPITGSASGDLEPAPADEAASPRFGQDPQDRKGSPAARRAARALASHRALQHVPYQRGELRIELVGARGHRAVLRVIAGTVQAARRGWRSFLGLHRDRGRAYIPLFKVAGAAGSRRGS